MSGTEGWIWGAAVREYLQREERRTVGGPVFGLGTEPSAAEVSA